MTEGQICSTNLTQPKRKTRQKVCLTIKVLIPQTYLTLWKRLTLYELPINLHDNDVPLTFLVSASSVFIQGRAK